MDINETISYLGRQEGRKLKICSEISELNPNIPFFEINDYRVRIGGYKNHDNASRMIFFASYLQDNILPGTNRDKSLNGFYNLELHDSYSYLHQDEPGHNDTQSYNNCLVWSKRKCDDHVILIPDVYHLTNYGNRFTCENDSLSFEMKNDKIGFWGTTTGNRNPLLNRRIQMCKWLNMHDEMHERSDCYITNVAQMKAESISDLAHIYKQPVSISFQYNYKFLLNIPGNTCSWDRVPLIMRSNSMLFNMPCDDMCFYYPLLTSGNQYIRVDTHDIFKHQLYYRNNHNEAKFITKNANNFFRNYLNGTVAKQYLISLFEAAATSSAK